MAQSQIIAFRVPFAFELIHAKKRILLIHPSA